MTSRASKSRSRLPEWTSTSSKPGSRDPKVTSTYRNMAFRHPKLRSTSREHHSGTCAQRFNCPARRQYAWPSTLRRLTPSSARTNEQQAPLPAQPVFAMRCVGWCGSVAVHSAAAGNRECRVALVRLAVDERSRLKQPPRVLVVEDHDDIRRLIALILRRHCYARSQTASTTRAPDLLASGEVDLAMVDLVLPGGSGADILVIRAADHKLRRGPRIAHGPHPRFDDASALALGACAVVRKPFEPLALQNLV